MAQNISLLGASYSNVPAVKLPKTGGGTAQFDDTTDANATEYDILQGKTAYVNGEKVTGVATGGSGDGSVWQDNQGFVNLDDDPGTHVEVESYTVSSSGTHTAPTGYAYSPVVVPSGSATTPATSITANPSISVNSSTGVITASVSGSKSVTPTVSSGYVTSGTSGTVSVSGSNTSQLSTQSATTITPSTSQQTAVAAGKYTTGAVTVSAMPSGTAGTPTASKGSVSNHSVTVTPSVTNSAGYISGGTKTGTGVTVTASELVSGSTITIDDSGNWDVTTAETAIVGAATAGTPTATKGTVSNHSVSVTPSVTNTAGYLYPGGTKTGTAVSVSASELVSGTKSITANGTDIDVTNYASVDVDVPTGGGGSVEEKDVNFYDYDGTRLYSYTATEFGQLSSLPPNPSHTGLTAQGWNWTKTQISDQLAESPNVIISVGQMYVTSSGDTEIDIEFKKGSAVLNPYLVLAVNGSVTINWGDNSSDTVTGTNVNTCIDTQHTYATWGKYTISIHVNSGGYRLYAHSADSPIITGLESTVSYNYAYTSIVKAVRLGTGLNSSAGSYSFSHFHNMEYITIPNTIGTISEFRYCYSLKAVIFPSSLTEISSYEFYYSRNNPIISIPPNVTTIGQRAFNYLDGLDYLTIPKGVTTLGNYALAYLYSLSNITLPSTITTIGTNAFNSSYGLREIHVKATNPPSLGTTNPFNNIKSTAKLYVPLSSLTTYQGHSVWGTFPGTIVGE